VALGELIGEKEEPAKIVMSAENPFVLKRDGI